MIDGDGNVRITDFGIATVEADTREALVATPHYMAPEQLNGKPASIKTDIYSLGLVLFEVFTGKRVHDAPTISELHALHDSGTVTTPSAIVSDLDPAIERVILRCLDKDPNRRPANALAVAAALPGADALAAALAAGETPSPELLASAEVGLQLGRQQLQVRPRLRGRRAVPQRLRTGPGGRCLGDERVPPGAAAAARRPPARIRPSHAAGATPGAFRALAGGGAAQRAGGADAGHTAEPGQVEAEGLQGGEEAGPPVVVHDDP